MATAWADFSQRKRFDLFIFAVLAIIIGVTIVVILLMGWIGIPIMSFLYGVDFGTFESLIFIMIVAGGITGGIDFLYQVITVIRRQKVVAKLYLITFGFSLLILPLLINMTGLTGAVIGYLIVMCILFVLLAMEYVRVRIEYARHPEADPVLVPSNGSAAAEANKAYVTVGQGTAAAARPAHEGSAEIGVEPVRTEKPSPGKHAGSASRPTRERQTETKARPAPGERATQEKRGDGTPRSTTRGQSGGEVRSAHRERSSASERAERPAAGARSTRPSHAAESDHPADTTRSKKASRPVKDDHPTGSPRSNQKNRKK